MSPALWALAGGVAGAIAGSFAAALVARWPKGETLGGRSKCDACGAQLRWFELVPLVSFAAQHGRCRRCGGAIDAQHFAIEAACALVGAIALFAHPGIEGFLGALCGWMLAALAALDVVHFWLPDRLTAALGLYGVAGVAFRIPPAALDRLIGGAAGFAALAAIAWSYRRLRGRDGLGAGDAKLLGAIGLWLGWRALPFVLVGACALGLAAALAMRLRGETVRADTRLPLGALMAVAAFPVWLVSR
ncbi:MAG: prepilin peptidase [Sphingomonadaceae bacterium]|nr:prepilin peptidase [Sphingomonadaceae bacterium]